MRPPFDPTPVPVTSALRLGPGLRADPGVIVGYLPGRAIPDTSLTVGRDARLRSGTVLYAGSVIGDGLETGHGVVIREENRIGRNLRIWNHSAIDYGCVIGDGVRIHNNVYVAQFTVIEDGVFLAPGVMIANDFVPVSASGWKGPVIRKGARIGINAVLLPGIEVGAGALVGAGSVVTRDVPAGMLAFGNPAKVRGPAPAPKALRS